MSATLTAGAFQFPPFTYECTDPIVISKNVSYCGIEITILKAVADALGKELVVQTPSDGNHHWGQFYENGTSDGLIYDIFHGVVDVGAGEFFNRVTRNRRLDPSDFYTYDYFCFLLKKPPPIPEWVQLIKPFQPLVWICFCATLITTIGFLILFAQLTGLIRNVVLQGISYFVNQALSMDVRSYPKLPHEITDMLGMPGMQWGTTGTSDYDEFVASPNPQIRDLADRFSKLSYWQEGFQRIQAGNYAFLNSLISSDYAIRTQFTDSHGVASMYIMNECWNIQQIVFYFPKGTQLKKPFDRVLQRLRESGLISKWVKDEMDKLAKLQESSRLDTKGSALTLDHLRAAFIIAAIVLAIAFLTLIMEMAFKLDYKTICCCLNRKESLKQV